MLVQVQSGAPNFRRARRANENLVEEMSVVDEPIPIGWGGNKRKSTPSAQKREVQYPKVDNDFPNWPP